MESQGVLYVGNICVILFWRSIYIMLLIQLHNNFGDSFVLYQIIFGNLIYGIQMGKSVTINPRFLGLHNWE